MPHRPDHDVARSPAQPLAVVSVDLDPLDTHLRGYGVDAERDRVVYDLATGRLLEALAAAQVRATFFVLGRDADSDGEVFRRIRDAGHEIASHGMHHPERFSRATDDALRHEIRGSRDALERAVDRPVIGFRAPNWDLDRRVVDELARAGYRYDSSLLPTPYLPVARIAVAAKARDPRALRRAVFLPASTRRGPFAWVRPEGRLAEYPVTVTPGVRIPLYHTLRYRMSDEALARRLDAIARRSEPLCYPLHAIDVLGLDDTGVPAALARHPGMHLDASAKRALLGRTLAAITARFAARRYDELEARA